jgi:DNA helicase-2/ATP-dependent DNA helicase PcrA
MTQLVEEESLVGLNPAQREAVTHFEGPMLVLAGAGSGKTRVLTMRIARLIEHHGVDPSRILAVTFTNKAAGEMRDRIGRLLGYEPKGMWCGTFHSIGARLLRIHAERVGRTQSFTIYDEDDNLAFIKRVMEANNISPKVWSPKMVASLISDAKNSLVSPEEYASLAMDPVSRNAANVYKHLEPALRAANAVTFDDLLTLPVELLQKDQQLREHLSNRFQFVLVDEYQDTNRAQYKFIKLIAESHGNIAVVGDPDQSIYGWRGADIRNILDFEKEFDKVRVVRLEENYRSTPNVLELANVVISANVERKSKVLRATRPAGEPPTVVAALDDRDEAEWVVDEITARMSRENWSARDFAILYRTNAQSRSLEDALRKRAMPYRLVGAVRFYDRREIRDLMAYLKLIANPYDNEAFRRAVSVPKRGLGDTTIETLAGIAQGANVSMLEASSRPDLLAVLRPAARTGLQEFAALINRFREAAQTSSVDELLRDLIEAIRYGDYLQSEGPEQARDRKENVAALIDGAAETVIDDGGEVGLRPLDHFLQRAMLVAGADSLDPTADAVTLMTMHNAKGLEFPIVFITGLEDGLFPTGQSFEEPSKMEEERRLFYVGITRAEQKLYMLFAESRRRNGEVVAGVKSRFLKEIPPGMVEERKTLKVKSLGRSMSWGESTKRKTYEVPAWRKPSPREEEVFESQDEPSYRVGERVKHKTFGSGTIVEVSGYGRDVKAVINFDNEEVGKKTIKLAYTTLEREFD